MSTESLAVVPSSEPSAPLRSSTSAVALAGATGGIGSSVLRYLLADDSISHILLVTRRPLYPDQVSKPAKVLEFVLENFTTPVDEIVSSLSPLLASASFPSLSAFFCCLGSTRAAAGSAEEFIRQDRDVIINISRVFAHLSVPVASLVSSIGADASSSTTYLKAKGEIENALADMKFASLSIYQPSTLRAHSRPFFRCGESMAVFMSRFCCCICLKLCCPKYDMIHVDTVAQAQIQDFKLVIRNLESRKGVKIYDGSAEIEAILNKK